MPSVFILKHPTTAGAGAPTAGGPWVYFVCKKVSFVHANSLNKMPRPNADVRMRRRATRVRSINLIGEAVADDLSPREVGVDSGAGVTGTGKTIMETLETAVNTWKDSGAIRLQIGLKEDGSAKFFDGLIDGITFDWEPERADEEVKAFRFTMQFTIGTVSS